MDITIGGRITRLGSGDVQIGGGGGPPVPAESLVTPDDSSIVGNGTVYHPLRSVGNASPIWNFPDNSVEVNLGPGSHDDVNFWGAGPRTTFVEVDLVGEGNTIITGVLAGNDGDMLIIWNGGGGTVPEDTITLISATSSTSQPLNQIWLANGKSVNIPNNDGVLLRYIGGFGWVSVAYTATMVRAQEFSLDPSTTPPALPNASTNHNYDPFTAAGGPVTSNVKQDLAGATADITGIIAAGAPNSEGRLLVFQNISATGSIAFSHENAGSAPANRLILPGGVGLTLGPLCCITFIYDLAVEMWRVQSYTVAAS